MKKEKPFVIPELETVDGIRNLIADEWNVVIWNDDRTPFGLVVMTISNIASMPANHAIAVAKEAHTKGKAVLMKTNYETAKTIATQITECIGIKMTIENGDKIEEY